MADVCISRSTNNLIRNVYLSTRLRDQTKFPSASDFIVDLPITLKQVHAIRIRNFKYTPEPVINSNNNTFDYSFSSTTGNGSGTITIPKGDYDQDISQILGVVNGYLNQYDVQFTLNPTTQFAQLVFAQPSGTNTFQMPYCGLLKLLGYANGIYLYRSGSPPSQASLPIPMIAYRSTSAATNAYSAVNDTDLILRIYDLEAIFSTDSVCHRATAVLMSNRSNKGYAYYLQEWPYPLLQIQHRIQTLRVSILNSDGDPYDLNDGDASFMIEFHCYPESSIQPQLQS